MRLRFALVMFCLCAPVAIAQPSNDLLTAASELSLDVIAGVGEASGDINFVATGHPSNDDVATAAQIGSFPAQLTGSVAGATREKDEVAPSCASGDNSIWWRFTPTAYGYYNLSTEDSPVDAVLAVYTASNLQTELECHVDPWTPLRFFANAGTTYYLRVSGRNGQEGDVAARATFEPATNDAVRNAHELTLYPGGLPLDKEAWTLGATDEVREASSTCAADAGSMWWTLTPSRSGTYGFETVDADFPATIAVYSGTSHPLAEVICHSGGEESFDAHLEVALTAGVTYYVRVAGREGTSGRFTFRATPMEGNDRFANAFDVGSSLPAHSIVEVQSFGVDPGEATLANGYPTAWWRFTPSESGYYAFESNGYGYLALWTGSAHPLTQIDHHFSYYSYEHVTLGANLQAGTTYSISLGLNPGAANGIKVLHVTREQEPKNDSLATAQPAVGPFPQTLTGSTFRAVAEAGQATVCDANEVTVWYRYTAEASGQLSATLASETFAGVAVFDSNMVLQASDCRTMFPYAPARDGDLSIKASAHRAEQLDLTATAPVEAGKSYLVRVSTSPGYPGAYTLTLDAPASLPVELVGFSAAANGRAARLSWSTVSETNNVGFVVEQQSGGIWTEASGLISGHGSSTERHDYAYAVNGLTAGTHTFRLRQLDTDGTVHLSGAVTVEIGVEESLVVTLLGQRAVRMETSAPRRVEVSVYDVLGRRVMGQEMEVSGTAEMALPALAAGSYVVRAVSDAAAQTKRLVVR